MDVTKLDAATHQLTTAIWLYFEDLDPISVHTLACAAAEVLDQLCAHRGVRSVRQELLDLVRTDKRKEVSRALNAARNFFKHADTDPDEVLTGFADDRNLYPLLLACLGLRRVLGEKAPLPVEVGVYEGWVSIIKPDALALPATNAASLQFGEEIRGEPRHVQKELGRDALMAVSGRADRWRRRGAMV